ncbi:hypothetical protein HRG_009305 [Hirsutella rhossiliensis]|uniref:BTB domain-containing protein n=1 Tax=Hirsutella rhossiliensis TaxID=111463 RepID=A0A9P8SE68_9HYPO|nr:uncharacterized protein HRG_09305 [Hirsutella rhossiliensis]KAH0959523.1 hypothetical protein HRG_09305 [Hirsutella rhossiliensis]
MESPIQQIDPDGDTLLILPDLWPDHLQQHRLLSSPVDELTMVYPSSKSTNIKSRRPNTRSAKPKQARSKTPGGLLKSPKMRMRLSSKHLMMASAYFKKMMTNGWIETNATSEYAYVVAATDWDPEALLILMRIIHGQTKEVPRTISLELLAKIAVLVDYYDSESAIAWGYCRWT